MSKERLYNDTVIDQERMPTEQLLALYEQMETLADKLHIQMESILDTVQKRYQEQTAECGEV